MALSPVTTKDFEDKVFNAKGLVAVDFWASWCGPCRQFTPILEQASDAHQDIDFLSLNVDEEPEISAEFRVSSIPSLIIFKDGVPVKTLVGARPLASLEAELKTL